VLAAQAGRFWTRSSSAGLPVTDSWRMSRPVGNSSPPATVPSTSSCSGPLTWTSSGMRPPFEAERVIFHAGPGDLIGELSLLTGQYAFLTARVMSAGSVVRISPAALRRVPAEQVDLADVLIDAFHTRRDKIRSAAGNSVEFLGLPDDAGTRELRTYVEQMLLPHAWLDATSPAGQSLMGLGRAGRGRPARGDGQRHPGAARRPGQRRHGARPHLPRRRRPGRPGGDRRGAGRAGRRGLRRLRRPRNGAARPLWAGRSGRQERPDRELSRVPAGHQRREPDPAGDASGAQVRRTHPCALCRGGPQPGRRATTGRPAGGRVPHRVRRGHRRDRGSLPADRHPALDEIRERASSGTQRRSSTCEGSRGSR
jgi:hypothetical protein